MGSYSVYLIMRVPVFVEESTKVNMSRDSLVHEPTTTLSVTHRKLITYEPEGPGDGSNISKND